MQFARKRFTAVAVTTALALVLAACGGDDDDDESSEGRGGSGIVIPPTDPPTSPPPTFTPPTRTPGECNLLDGLVVFLECKQELTSDPVDVAVQNAAPPDSGITDQVYPYTVEEYIVYILEDVNRMWGDWFAGQGMQRPTPGYYLVASGFQHTSECEFQRGVKIVASDSFPNAFYCPFDQYTDADGMLRDGSLVLPLTTFQKMWTGEILNPSNRSNFVGDFAAAIIVAHEYGHHVRNELYETLVLLIPGLQPPQGKYDELIADCFAGVWMASAYHSGVLTDTDYYEAVAALEAIGDKPGVVTNDPHGTPEERRAALLHGYNGDAVSPPGDPMVCMHNYWPVNPTG